MVRLSLAFLGIFGVTLDGKPVGAFKSDKVRALLAYLAVQAQRPHPREVLAALLWPDWPQRSAAANLRDALSSLRRTIGDLADGVHPPATPPFLLISRETIQFNPTSDYALDVAVFAELVAEGGADDQPTMERLRHAVALYRGAFLEGFSLVDSARFEEWVTLQREHLARQMLEALERLAGLCEQAGEYEQAQGYARQQVEMEPTREEAHRQLMRALALGGERNAALAQYETCRRLLARELGVEPARETTALCEATRRGVFPTPGSPQPTALARLATQVSIGALSPFPGAERAPVEVERHPVVARERELAQLGRFLDLALAGQGRVAFVTGDPGMGKTTLVGEFVRQAMGAHPDLVVAQGNGNAYTGLGDPYLPFLEALQMLSGDVAARWAGGGITREHAQRLWALVPDAVQALLEHAPQLIDLRPWGGAAGTGARLCSIGCIWPVGISLVGAAGAGSGRQARYGQPAAKGSVRPLCPRGTGPGAATPHHPGPG